MGFYFFKGVFREVKLHGGKQKYLSGYGILDKRRNKNTRVEDEYHYVFL
jgi:hypothetical protein